MTRTHDGDGDATAQPPPDALATLSFADHTLQSVLQKVTDLAAGIVRGEPAASVTVLRGDRPSTVAASGPLAREFDEVQYRSGSGPCLHAAWTGSPVLIADTRTDDRWAELARYAAEHGCRSTLSCPLPAREAVTGSLNLYTAGAAADEHALRLLARFAASAVVPVSNMYLYSSAVHRAEHLAVALESRAVIERAKGILMERYRMTPDQAFQALAQVSMDTNRKVRELAEELVRTGDLPSP